MRSQRWVVLAAVVVAALIGVLIAGVPKSQEDLDLKPLVTTTTTSSTTTTTVPVVPTTTTVVSTTAAP